MRNQKKSFFLLGIDKDQWKFLNLACIFFIPVVIGYFILEYTIRQIPNIYSVFGTYLDENKDILEVVIFGSSQVKNSVNPEFIDKPAINLSSSGQHHNTDFELLKKLRPTLPSLKTVVFEVSYGHFELPHNSKYYWKNALFLKYYNVNIFKRNLFIADRLLFMAHPAFFSDILVTKLLEDTSESAFNKYGFEHNRFTSQFNDLGYNLEEIKKTKIKLLRRPDKKIFEHNVNYFYLMLDYCEKEGLKTVIISTPTFTNYNEARNPDILRRRDSIIQVALKTYKNVTLLNEETDTIFHIKDFRDQNHLVPSGAEKFTKLLNNKLKE